MLKKLKMSKRRAISLGLAAIIIAGMGGFMVLSTPGPIDNLDLIDGQNNTSPPSPFNSTTIDSESGIGVIDAPPLELAPTSLETPLSDSGGPSIEYIDPPNLTTEYIGSNYIETQPSPDILVVNYSSGENQTYYLNASGENVSVNRASVPASESMSNQTFIRSNESTSVIIPDANESVNRTLNQTMTRRGNETL